MDKTAAEKKERLLAALERGMVMIHLDARRPGVVVPRHLSGEPHLRLNLSYRFDPPDLSVADGGIRSTLRFAGSRFTVAIPWTALFAITSHVEKELCWMYPEDLPPELLQQHVGAQALGEHPEPSTGRGRSCEMASAEDEAGEKKPEDDGSPPRRGHLRIVK